MIELDRVTRHYGRRVAAPPALGDVTLSLAAGAVWAVVGPNGAGKSTLLSLVLGFIRPSAGAITIAGEAPRDYLREHGASYLPERFRLPAEWRVRDAVRLFARLERSPADAAMAVIARFGLDSHAGHRIGELSRGLLQRVGLAQALVAPRGLVVLDEPTEGLDPLWRIRLRDVVASLRDAGSTVIMASHDLGEVERMADHAVLLERGAVRDVIDIRTSAGTVAYDITLSATHPAAGDVFPGIDSGALSFRVHVTGAHELSDRLAAFIAAGGVVEAVVPVRDALEDRVRATLERDL